MAISTAINVIMIIIIWRLLRWRRHVKATMHAALKMAKKTSDSVRFVRFEPWRDEYIQNATDGIDALFSIIFAYVYPEIEVMINMDETPRLTPPTEPGSD
jgi:hypothetical protein